MAGPAAGRDSLRSDGHNAASPGIWSGGLPESWLYESWARCQVQHCLPAPARVIGPVLCQAELRQAKQRMGRMLGVALEVLEHLSGLVVPFGYVALLCDADGVVLAHRAPASLERRCRRWNLHAGAIWSEDLVGTNGVGTCLVEGRPVTVHEVQHWSAALHRLTCCAAPFYGADGRIAGAFNVTMPHPGARLAECRVLEALLAEAARRFEMTTFCSVHEGRDITLLAAAQRLSTPMIARDSSGRIVGASYAARHHPSPGERDVAAGSSDRLALSAPDVRLPDFDRAARAVIRDALAMSSGKVAPAARLLGISRATLYRRMSALELGRNHEGG
ncbi:GAF domain-containing protein [Swaminathania salitolerans]|uniref:Fis family transcriptional regulator n=1 Tax=Swaminathania salitolerans TaxID=182838 RepID=A0A511BQC0_9PROT|nr:GAF domain-containing protein [Swaminathania salitolerans]GBQ11554.1 acetoin catabolism regulatory protein [Swaminathania salitolerans LMG 21291]GEL02529.1 Fis family transcriptional regulator [Swaminathania salitolerans]